MKKIKTVYSFDKYTREYLGETPAHLCPVKMDRYNIPANSTDKKPLSEKRGQAIVFTGDKWDYVEDNRGANIYSVNSGEKVGIITNIMYALETDQTLLPPSPNTKWNGEYWEILVYTKEELIEQERQKIFLKRNKERGSIVKQWEFFIDNGYDALKGRDDKIKSKYPIKNNQMFH